MKFSAITTTGIVLVWTTFSQPAAAQATHTAFTGSIGFANPCNSEIVVGTGPVRIVYAANHTGELALHSTFRVETEGNQGRAYIMSFESNDQFDEPSGAGPGYVYFDAPIHGEVVGKGSAPNFSWDLYWRVYVSGGIAVGSIFIGPSTTTCKGA